MKNAVICLVIIIGAIPVSSIYSSEADINKHWGIGLEANFPLVGGLSVRYYGFSPIYLQLVSLSILDDNNRDNMIGGGISYAILEFSDNTITRLYFTLEGGERYEKDAWKNVSYDPYGNLIGNGQWEISYKIIYGIGLVFGTEFTFPVFGTQIGLNIEVGQGFGRIKEDYTDSPSNKFRDTASIIFGSGIHVYF